MNIDKRWETIPIYRNKDYIKIMRPLPGYIQRDIWDIPCIEAQSIDISKLNNGQWLINMKNVSCNDKNPDKKIVHSFNYDNVLYRSFNNPIKYLERVAKYYAVSSFDFSMDDKMDFIPILNAIYNNRWSGAFMQAHGKLVIPTVGWLTSETYDICFAGLRDGGVFIISTLGANNMESHSMFLDGYYELRKRFPSTAVICVGQRLDGMDDDVCYVSYKESFGNWDKYHDYWQPKIFNWDGTIDEEVV